MVLREPFRFQSLRAWWPVPKNGKLRAHGQGCAKLVSSKWSVASGEENVGGLRLEAIGVPSFKFQVSGFKFAWKGDGEQLHTMVAGRARKARQVIGLKTFYDKLTFSLCSDRLAT
jgi:hypothetical protein